MNELHVIKTEREQREQKAKSESMLGSFERVVASAEDHANLQSVKPNSHFKGTGTRTERESAASVLRPRVLH